MPQTPPFAGQLNSGGYNKNLFQTKQEGFPGLYYHDNNLVSGSLEALIHHLVPTVDYYPDVSVVWLEEAGEASVKQNLTCIWFHFNPT